MLGTMSDLAFPSRPSGSFESRYHDDGDKQGDRVMKPRTLRLDEETDARLAFAATVLDISVTECIRASLEAWFNELEQDQEFQTKVTETIERTDRLFGRRDKKRTTKRQRDPAV